MSQSKGVRAGKAYVELGANDSALTKGLRAAQAKLQKFGSSMKYIGAVVGGVGVAGLGMFMPAISSASRLQETMAKFDVVFGNNSSAVKEWSDNFASEVGRSEEMVASFMASNQDLLVPMGLEPGAATEMSKEITGLAIDLASFNNMADADAQRDLQAAITGSGEVMKKYGVVMDQAAVNQELLNKGLDPKNATNSQKAYARMAIILRGTTAAQGDAVRSGGSWANVQKRIFAELDNLAATIGSALLPALSSIGEYIAKVIKSISGFVAVNKKAILIVAAIAAGVVAAGATLIALGFAATLLASAIGVAISVGGVLAAVIGAVASPIGAAIAAVAALAAGFFYLTDVGSSVISWFQTGFANLLNIVTGTVGGIYNAISAGRLDLAAEIAMTGVKLVFATVMESILGIFGGSIDGMMQMLAGLYKRIEQVMSRLAALQQKAINAASSAIAALGFGSAEDERGRRLEAERKRLLESQGKDYTANDTSLAANLADIQNADTAAANGRITDADAIDTAALGKSWADEFDPESLRKKLDELNATAAAKAATEAQAAAAPGALDTSLLDNLRGGAMQAKAVQGTFSARAATQLGSGNWQDRVAKGIEKIVKHTDPKKIGKLVITD